jgi:hypothetical protein
MEGVILLFDGDHLGQIEPVEAELEVRVIQEKVFGHISAFLV